MGWELEQRKKRLEAIKLTMKNAGGKVDRTVLIARLCESQGLTRKKGEEYISILIDAERIEVVGDYLILKEEVF